jgi:hypothetical protein
MIRFAASHRVGRLSRLVGDTHWIGSGAGASVVEVPDGPGLSEVVVGVDRGEADTVVVVAEAPKFAESRALVPVAEDAGRPAATDTQISAHNMAVVFGFRMALTGAGARG